MATDTIRFRIVDGGTLVAESDLSSLPVGVTLTATVERASDEREMAEPPAAEGDAYSPEEQAEHEAFMEASRRRHAAWAAKGPEWWANLPSEPWTDENGEPQPYRLNGRGVAFPAEIGDGTGASIVAAIRSGELKNPWEFRDIGDSVEHAAKLRERSNRPRYDREGNRIEYSD